MDFPRSGPVPEPWEFVQGSTYRLTIPATSLNPVKEDCPSAQMIQ